MYIEGMSGFTAYLLMSECIYEENWFAALHFAKELKNYSEGWIPTEGQWDTILKGCIMLDELGYVNPMEEMVLTNEC